MVSYIYIYIYIERYTHLFIIVYTYMEYDTSYTQSTKLGGGLTRAEQFSRGGSPVTMGGPNMS